MTRTIISESDLIVIQCAACGVSFAIPETMRKGRIETGADLYCPNGHALSWKETRSMKLERELQRERALRDQAEAEARRLNSARAFAEQDKEKVQKKLSRMEKRIAGGVCPCCNRHFPDLHSHMTSKHPDAQKAAEVSQAPSRRRASKGAGQ